MLFFLHFDDSKTLPFSSFFLGPAVWGMLAVLATLAISIPWYLIIHLAISSTASHPTIENLSVPVHELKALVVNIIVGFILPTLVVLLPEGITRPLFTREMAIAVWQLWPIWSTAVHFMAKWFISTRPASSPSREWERTRTTFRLVYGLTFAVAITTHIASWAISLTAAYAVSNSMAAETVQALHPRTVFMNTWPWSPIKADSVGQGLLWMIQWDKFFSVGAMYLWSLSLYRAAHAAQSKKIDWYYFALKTAVFCMVSGFTGATIELLWEREEMILEAGRGNEKKK